MIRLPAIFVFTVLVAVLMGQSVAQESSGELTKANSWHQWRGPDANGVSKTARPPLKWSETENVLWKVPIEGSGSTTPIVWGRKVFLLTSIDTGRIDASLPKPQDQPDRPFGIKFPNTTYSYVVLCLDRLTGDELWRRTATERIPHEGHHGDNNFASASPTTDGRRLYCWFGSAGLFCYDLNGERLWDRDLGTVDTRRSFGEGCSPVLYDGKLVIVRDQEKQSYITVLDAGNGKTLWQIDRDEPSAWATPQVVSHDGVTQVITSATNRVRSYDLSDGRLIWECGGQVTNVIPSPVVENGVVFCMSGYRGSALYAIPLSAKGNVSGSDTIAWRKERGTPYVPSPLLYDGMLYFNQSNRAILSCLDAKTGDTIIERTRLPGLSNVYASPVGADDRIYLTGRDGRTLVLKRDRELKVLATNRLDDPIDASPALAGNQIFLRGKSYLYGIANVK